MAINQKRNWLVTYDIADPKRLGRIHRCIIKHALPVQYSVYLYNGTRREAKNLMDQLAQIINPKEDDLRAYPIPSKAEINTIGESGLLDQLILSDDNYGDELQLIRRG